MISESPLLVRVIRAFDVRAHRFPETSLKMAHSSRSRFPHDDGYKKPPRHCPTYTSLKNPARRLASPPNLAPSLQPGAMQPTPVLDTGQRKLPALGMSLEMNDVFREGWAFPPAHGMRSFPTVESQRKVAFDGRIKTCRQTPRALTLLMPPPVAMSSEPPSYLPLPPLVNWSADGYATDADYRRPVHRWPDEKVMSGKARRTAGVRSGRFADLYKRFGSPTRSPSDSYLGAVLFTLSSSPSWWSAVASWRPRPALNMVKCGRSSGKSHGWEMTPTPTQEGR
ncbi:hypothetical protein C8F01DRAFT_1262437 [Mycena amicta]|nr:hypothetical protein C8F01DRAFT_1262397 [Mycena amicta]KAJ7051925.1 hypothetical protein C8F01DRAFT_1262437 [Mycena amicta]